MADVVKAPGERIPSFSLPYASPPLSLSHFPLAFAVDIRRLTFPMKEPTPRQWPFNDLPRIRGATPSQRPAGAEAAKKPTARKAKKVAR
jgi:hypothetical protein